MLNPNLLYMKLKNVPKCLNIEKTKMAAAAKLKSIFQCIILTKQGTNMK